MSYKDAADAITRSMYAACKTAEQRELLADLLAACRPWVTDLKSNFGVTAPGFCDVQTNRVYLAAKLRWASPVDVLGVYLHEAVHAGATGMPPRAAHDQIFCDEVARVYAIFGLVLTDRGQRYCTQDNPERQPSLLSLAGIIAPLAMSGILMFQGYEAVQAAPFFVVSAVVFVLEKIRLSAA